MFIFLSPLISMQTGKKSYCMKAIMTTLLLVLDFATNKLNHNTAQLFQTMFKKHASMMGSPKTLFPWCQTAALYSLSLIPCPLSAWFHFISYCTTKLSVVCSQCSFLLHIPVSCRAWVCSRVDPFCRAPPPAAVSLNRRLHMTLRLRRNAMKHLQQKDRKMRKTQST